MKKKLSRVLTSLALCFAIGGLFAACDGKTGPQGDKGEQGVAGKSAYEIWLALGNEGTEADFIASLVGAKGDDGDQGDVGSTGKSAYEIWTALGNDGTEADFIASLVGAKGDKGDKGDQGEAGKDGEDGQDGANGADGKSAYEIWLAMGNEGTEADFIASLTGPKGDQGDAGKDGEDGKSAYEIWTALGNEGTEEDFIASLAGVKGNDGVDGEDGRGVESVTLANGQLVFTYTDGEKVTLDLTSTCTHVWNEYVLETHTCDAKNVVTPGTKIQTCKTCGWAQLVEEVCDEESFVETYHEYTCTTDAYWSYDCPVCGYEKDPKIDTANPAKHALSTYNIAEDGKTICLDKSREITVCTVDGCDYYEVKDDAPAKGHVLPAYDEWTIVTAPTKANAGKATFVCVQKDDKGNILEQHEVEVTLPKLSEDAYAHVADYNPVNCWYREGTDIYTIYVYVDLESENANKLGYSKTEVENAVAFTFETEAVAANHMLAGQRQDPSKVYYLNEATRENADEQMLAEVALITETTEKATCLTTGKGIYTCEDCHETVIVTTALYHEYDKATAVETTPAGCESTGWLSYDCKLCNAPAGEEIPALGHDYKYDINYVVAEDATYLTTSCTRHGTDTSCTYVQNTVKLDENPEITKEPTCTEVGEMTLVIGGKTTTAELPMTGHKVVLKDGTVLEHKDTNLPYNLDEAKYVGVINETTDKATCHTPGKGLFTCKDCNGQVVVSTTRNHTATGTEEIVTYPDCETPGLKKVDCTVCAAAGHVGKVEVVIPALGHNYEYSFDAATKVLTITCNGHDMDGDGVVDVCVQNYLKTLKVENEDESKYVAPTCTAEGVRVYVYESADGLQEYPVVLPKTGHFLNGVEQTNPAKVYNLDVDAEAAYITETTDKATCQPGGKGVYTCTKCETPVVVATIRNCSFDPAADTTVIVPSTCTKYGTKTYKCLTCSETKTEYTAPLGHNLVVNEEAYVAPTLTNPGELVVVCTECADGEFKVTLPALNKTDYTYTGNPASCFEAGNEVYTKVVTVQYMVEYYLNGGTIVIGGITITDPDNFFINATAEFTVSVKVESDRTQQHADKAADAKVYCWTEEVVVEDVNLGEVTYIVSYEGYVCEDCGKMVATEVGRVLKAAELIPATPITPAA